MDKRLRRVVTSGLSLAIVIGAFVALAFERNNIFDWSRLHDYAPPTAITQLAHDTTMTGKARTLLYINHPALDGKTAFDKACPPGSEHTIVLGCYHPVEQGIFLYRVSDPQLNGVEQVTAAHEMLHAAYDRLGSHERTYVDGLLENYYQHDLHDPTVLAEIAAYKKSEPHDVMNEMHSVFGTEIAHLPPPLEQYYEQYFTNRQKIAQYAAEYRSAFTTREAAVHTYDRQLADLKPEITTDESKLKLQLEALDTQKSQLNAESAANNTSAYNARVNNYNSAVTSYDALLATTKQLISQYDAVVDKRNAIAFEEQQLTQELTSTPISN